MEFKKQRSTISALVFYLGALLLFAAGAFFLGGFEVLIAAGGGVSAYRILCEHSVHGCPGLPQFNRVFLVLMLSIALTASLLKQKQLYEDVLWWCIRSRGAIMLIAVILSAGVGFAGSLVVSAWLTTKSARN